MKNSTIFKFLSVQKVIEVLSKFLFVAALTLASSHQLNAMESKGQYTSEKSKSTLDLHGLKAREGIEKVIGFIKEQHNNFETECTIITGKGNHVNSNGSSAFFKQTLPKLAQGTELKPYIKSINLDSTGGSYTIELNRPVSETFAEDDDVKTSHIDLSMNEIESYIGENIKFYEEYNAQEERFNQVSFPMNKCYPILLEDASNTRWFFSSAIKGNVPRAGGPIEVINPSITHVYAVRGEISNNHWVHVYFGIDIHNPKFFNNTHAVYQGKILYLFDNIKHYHSNDAQYLNCMTIASEVSHYLSDTKDWNWNSPAFQKIIKNLFLQKDGSNISDKYLLSSVCYWDKTENKEIQ